MRAASLIESLIALFGDLYGRSCPNAGYRGG
jgi:hypothetical protein